MSFVDYEAPDSGDERYAFKSATLGARLLGAMVDGLFGLGALFVVRMMMHSEPSSFDDLAGVQALQDHPLPTVIGTLAQLAVNAWLIEWRGQSVGKLIAGTRIVDEEGRRMGLVRGFAIRTLPFVLIGLVAPVMLATGSTLPDVEPVALVTGLVAIVDVALIFRTYQRCLHDRIAGTYVAVAGTERRAREAAARPARKKKRRAQAGA
jgi:uncharacterized RDD family membrane protein YckC